LTFWEGFGRFRHGKIGKISRAGFAASHNAAKEPSAADFFWRLGEEQLRNLRDHCRSGCPLGSARFVKRLEQEAGRIFRPQKPGYHPKLLKRP
jgi:hypothetical protein